MQGSTLGVWVAHGEGKALFPNEKHLNEVVANNLAPLRYVDDENAVTQVQYDALYCLFYILLHSLLFFFFALYLFSCSLFSPVLIHIHIHSYTTHTLTPTPTNLPPFSTIPPFE